MALQDFEMLLVSVIPYKSFSRFLHKEHPEMVPYLQMVHLCKLYQDDQEMLQELQELEEEQAETRDQAPDRSFSKKRLTAH